MVIRKEINKNITRPVIDILVNGYACNALIDTGAESIVWSGNKDILHKLCNSTYSKGVVSGLGGRSAEYDIYDGTILIRDSDSNNLRSVTYKKCKIMESDYKSKYFDIILPFNLFMKFSISFTNEDKLREFIIDTKREGEYFYILEYDENNIISDVLSQAIEDTFVESKATSFNVMKSFL